jgi:hypothetical protein
LVPFRSEHFVFSFTTLKKIKLDLKIINSAWIMKLKLKGKRLLARVRCRWEDIREIEWGGMDWTDQAQDRDQLKQSVKVVMNIRVK